MTSDFKPKMRGYPRSGLGFVTQLEPLFRQQNIDGSTSQVFRHIFGFLDDLEGIRRSSGLSLVDNVTDNLGGLASVGIDDGSDLRFSRNNVADAEGEAPSSIRKPSERWTKLRRSLSIGWGEIAFIIAVKVWSGYETHIQSNRDIPAIW